MLDLWRFRLTKLELPEGDVTHVLSVPGAHALDSHYLTDRAPSRRQREERLATLDATPAVQETVWGSLLIVIRADPRFDKEVEVPISQIGDPQWTEREAAHERLQEIGATV